MASPILNSRKAEKQLICINRDAAEAACVPLAADEGERITYLFTAAAEGGTDIQYRAIRIPLEREGICGVYSTNKSV
jgi:hypothetical protein